MSSDTRVAKIEVRSEVRARRNALTPLERRRRRDGLTTQLTALIAETGARSVTAYAPLGSEPDTEGFLAWARASEVRVLLPVSLPGHRLAWAVDTGDRVNGLHGIAEPDGPRLEAAAAAEVDLMLIPACAVDARGTRLGWGLGYYDRALEAITPRPPLFAIVDDDDLYPWLPREAHDIPVDGVVTATSLRRFSTE